MVLLLCGLIATPSFAKEQISLPPQPLAFEHNQGQAGGHAEYLARGKGYLLYLRATEAVLALKGTGTTKPLRLRLLGATPHAKTAGQTPLPGRHNYYIGNNPARWYTNIPTYARVAASGVYPGIDMVYYGKDGMLEYDFKVAAGADPQAIRLGFDGVDKLRVNHNGELLITAGKAQLVQHAPYAYQNIDGKRVPVAAGYALHGRTVSFALGDYDHLQPLIIDPALSYSSYLGGSNDDEAKAVAVDGDGNIYVTGWTLSTDFPEAATTTGTTLNPSSTGNNSDAFVTMLNKHGTIVFSTYLGSSGTIDSGYNTPEGGYGIAVSSGKIYVTGVTASQAGTAFPSLGNPTPYQACNLNTNSVFVSILNNNGSLYYSTCVGNGLTQVGTGIAVDGTGDAYVAGWTTSNTFPHTSNAIQATKDTPTALRSSFFFKLDPTQGTSGLLYSTYLGSTQGASALCCDTYATAVAVDSANMAYVAGWTGVSATDFPTAFQTALSSGAYPTNNGGKDAFFYKIDPSPSAPSRLLYATYLGGSGDDTAAGIAIAPTASGDPDVYITGQTLSFNLFPVSANAFQSTFKGGTTLGDAFIAKFSSASSDQYALAYSTYLGGSGEDGATGIAVDSTTGRAYVTGGTTSPDFPLRNATYLQTVFNPNNSTGIGKDAFVTSLELNGQTLHYSTYLGGEVDDQGQGIAVATGDKAYVVGYTGSFTYPVSTDAAQKLNQSNNQVAGLGFDAFVSRIAPVSNLSVTLAAHPTNDLQSNTAPQLGDSLTYSVIVANPLGPDPATGITLTFELSTPDIPGTTTPLLNPVSDPNICQYDGNKLFTCTLPDLAVGGQQTLAITGTLTYGQSLTATATANSNEIDAVAASYTLSAGQPLPPPATTVTGGTTPTPTTASASGGGAIGGPLLLLLMLASLIHRARVPRCGKPRVDSTHV